MFKKILVPLDRSPLSEQAIGQAAAIARAGDADIDVVLVHEPFAVGGYDDAPWYSEEMDAEHAYLEAVAEELRCGASVHATHAIMRGDPAQMIAERADAIQADLIVMTTHGRTGLSRAWLGSVADAVMRHSSSPVLMLRPSDAPMQRRATRHPFRHVLVPVDGSPASLEMLDLAAFFAKTVGASLTLLQVAQPIPLFVAEDLGTPFVYSAAIQDDEATEVFVARVGERLDPLVKRLESEQHVTVDAHVVVGVHVSRSIVDFARGHDVDVIAMSTHGRGASRLIVGSVADKVLRSCDVPVLLKRPTRVVDAQPVRATNVLMHELPALAPA